MTRKQFLLNACRVYKGQPYNPYSNPLDGRGPIWAYERRWVLDELDTESEDSKERLGIQFDNYTRCGLLKFSMTDDIPVQLKAAIFQAYCNKNELSDIDGFKAWYADEYSKLKP